MYNVQCAMYNENMPKTVPNAFTLVELLVVIAIMAIIGAYTLSNYASFGEDQKLKNAVLDVVSLLRQAQTNATAKAICQNKDTDASWYIAILGGSGLVPVINLSCEEPSGLTVSKRRLNLSSDIQVSAISGNHGSCPTVPGSVQVLFASANGQAKFRKSGNISVDCTLLTVTLRNKKGSTQELKIEQGGRVYAQ